MKVLKQLANGWKSRKEDMMANGRSIKVRGEGGFTLIELIVVIHGFRIPPQARDETFNGIVVVVCVGRRPSMLKEAFGFTGIGGWSVAV